MGEEERHCLSAAVLASQGCVFKVCFVRPYSFFHDVLGSTQTTTTQPGKCGREATEIVEGGVFIFRANRQTGQAYQSMGSSLMKTSIGSSLIGARGIDASEEAAAARVVAWAALRNCSLLS